MPKVEFGKELAIYHTHDYYIIAIIESGECEHFVDFQHISFGDKTILFTRPGQYHTFRMWNNIQGYSICFDEYSYRGLEQEIINLIKHSLFSDLKCLKLEDVEQFEDILTLTKRLYQESCQSEPSLYMNYELKVLLQFLMLKIIDYYSQKQELYFNNSTCLYMRFLEKVEENFKQWHKVAQYADFLHVGYKELAQSVKQETMNKPIDIILNRIIFEAKKQLVFSDKSIKEISAELGFDEQSNFSLLFKKKRV